MWWRLLVWCVALSGIVSTSSRSHRVVRFHLNWNLSILSSIARHILVLFWRQRRPLLHLSSLCGHGAAATQQWRKSRTWTETGEPVQRTKKRRSNNSGKYRYRVKPFLHYFVLRLKISRVRARHIISSPLRSIHLIVWMDAAGYSSISNVSQSLWRFLGTV